MMKATTPYHLRLLPLFVLGALALGCDSPTEPGDDVNADLVAEANSAGFGSSADGLPQGSDGFAGPGGIAMEATAEQFIQQLTLRDGTVLRTSGVGVYAVPDETVAASVIDRVAFGTAHTGSHEPVTPGTYALGPWPDFDFIEPVDFSYAQVRPTGAEQRVTAEEGEIVIESMEYFPDVYPCQLAVQTLAVDLCEYQLGLLRGAIEFSVVLEDGTAVVQERTEFTLPIRRRTIIARQT